MFFEKNIKSNANRISNNHIHTARYKKKSLGEFIKSRQCSDMKIEIHKCAKETR